MFVEMQDSQLVMACTDKHGTFGLITVIKCLKFLSQKSNLKHQNIFIKLLNKSNFQFQLSIHVEAEHPILKKKIF